MSSSGQLCAMRSMQNCRKNDDVSTHRKMSVCRTRLGFWIQSKTSSHTSRSDRLPMYRLNTSSQK